MSQDPVVVELVRRVTNLEDDLMRQTARISVPVSGAFFSAYATGTTALSAGVATTVALGATTYTDGNFNTSTSTYTCPVAGHYLFCGAVAIQATAAGYGFVSIYHGASELCRGTETYVAAGNYLDATVTCLLNCAAGYSIVMLAYSGGAGTANPGLAVNTTYLMGQIQ